MLPDVRKLTLLFLMLMVCSLVIANGGKKAVFTEQFMTVDDTLLTFTITFENAGPDTSRAVIVIDSISPYLDTSTFEPGPASHPYKFAWLADHVACWVFTDVELPSIEVDPAASHIFVKYHIDHLETEHELSDIENVSQVHFSTNGQDVERLLGEFDFEYVDHTASSHRNDLGIEVIQGQHAGEIEILTPPSCTDVQLTVEIFNETGIVEFLGKLNNDHHIYLDTSFLKNGKHFLSVYDNHHHESVSYFVSH